MENQNAVGDRAIFEEAREVSRRGLKNGDNATSMATKYGYSDSTASGEEITIPTALILKNPAAKQVLEECNTRIVYCRSLIANISTIRDVLHDAFDEILSSGDFQYAQNQIDKRNSILAINEHISKHPRAPDWAPYTYSDAFGTNIEMELGVLPGFEILHRHGDTAHLVQWIVHQAPPRPIDSILEHDSRLHELAESMVSLMEDMNLARIQWKRDNERVAALQNHELGRGLTLLQVQKILRKSRETPAEKFDKIDDIIIAEADRLADSYIRLDKLLKRADDAKDGILHAISDPNLTSDFLGELRKIILRDELASGRRQDLTHHEDERDLESSSIDGTYKAVWGISWNKSNEITFRHKTSRRFEQFPHDGFWFDIAEDYMMSEIDYLKEKAAEILDTEQGKLAGVQEVLSKNDSIDQNMENVEASLQLQPSNPELIKQLEYFMTVSRELNRLIEQEGEKPPFNSGLKEAVTSIYHDFMLISRLNTLRQDPASQAYENLHGELYRDIIEMVLATEENILEAFQLLHFLSQEEQKRHLTTQATIWRRFSASKWTNQLSDAELSQSESWEAIRQRADFQQRLTRKLLAEVQASIRAGNGNKNTGAMNKCLSGNQNSKHLDLEIGFVHLTDRQFPVGPAGPRVEPTSSRPWAFSRLYRFFTSPDIGPKFDTKPLTHEAQSPWYEPQHTFLLKVNGLVRNPISNLEMREFLQTCHRRRLLFAYCCRLHVVEKVERGWGAINTSLTNKEEMPRMSALPKPTKNYEQLVAAFNRHRADKDFDLYHDRDFSAEYVLNLANKFNLAGHTMTEPEFATFYKTCNDRAELFLTRKAGRLTRINNGWDNHGNPDDPSSLLEFEKTLWQDRKALGIVDRNGNILRDFAEQSEILRYRWNRAADVARNSEHDEKDKSARQGPMSRDLWEAYLNKLCKQERYLRNIPPDKVGLIYVHWTTNSLIT